MFIELALLSGIAGYAMFRQHAKSKAKFINELVVIIKPEPLTPLQKFKHYYIDPFLHDSRQTHLKTLQGQGDSTNPIEQYAKTRFLWFSGALALAVLGTTVAPVFFVPTLMLILLYIVEFTKTAWHALTVERRVSNDLASVIFFIGAVVGEFYFFLAITGWFFTLVLYLTVKTEDHSKRNLVSLFGEQSRTVWLWVDGAAVLVPFEQIQVGQVIVVQAGQMILVDGVIVQGIATIDQHMLTGEAQPVEKTVDDTVLASTFILGGRLLIKVTKTGQQTVAAQIAEILNQTSDFKDTLKSEALTFVDKATLPVLGVTAAAWWLSGLSQALGVMMVHPGYRLLVLNPLTMLSSLHLAAQRGILIKDGRSLELLRQIDTMVFDKTGTLTLEQPQVQQIHVAEGWTPAEVLRLAAIAEHKQSHPLAQAILHAAREQALTWPEVDLIDYQIGFGIKANFNGQSVVVGSQRFMQQEAIAMTPEMNLIEQQCHDMGHSLVWVGCDGLLVGGIELAPTVRPEAQQVMAKLQARGLHLVIISGDHTAPTQHLAQSLGVENYYAEVLPQDKAKLVAQLEAQGRKVCFVGDGINDAIALKQATTSISLQGATSVATDTAQIILMDTHLEQLIHLLDLAEQYNKITFRNFLSATVPTGFYLGGAYFFNWGILVAFAIQQTVGIWALYHVMRPLLDENQHQRTKTY